MPVSGSVALTAPCTGDPFPSYDVGEDIDGTAEWELDVPDAGETYRYKVDFKSVALDENCSTVASISNTGEITGPNSVPTPELPWTHEDAQEGVYQARIELSVEKKLNGTWGPVQVLALQTCLYRVGDADTAHPFGRILAMGPCGTQEVVLQEVLVVADMEIGVIGGDEDDIYAFDHFVNSVTVETNTLDGEFVGDDEFRNGEQPVLPLSPQFQWTARRVGWHRVTAQISAARWTGMSSSSTDDPCAKYSTLAVKTCLYEVIDPIASSSSSGASSSSSSSSGSPSSSSSAVSSSSSSSSSRR